jgi:hypothetical protein
MTVREWLPRNGYEDVAALITEVLAEFELEGSKERRNWADVLSGGKDGNPLVVSGRTFPVLRSAQESRNKQVTVNAIKRPEEYEPFPRARQTGRWPKKLPVRARRMARKSARKPVSRSRAS